MQMKMRDVEVALHDEHLRHRIRNVNRGSHERHE